VKQISAFIATLSLFSSIACGLSENTKRMIASISVGCAVGLAVGAVYDESQRKKDSKNKSNDFQRQIKESLLREKKKPQNKGKIVGLGAGCLAGVGAGFYLNTMYDNMNEQLSKDGIALEKRAGANGETEALLVKMDGGISFEDGKADLKGKGKENLDKLAEALAAYPETKVNVTGHANKTGSEDMNQKLSQNRADTAKTEIIGAGVDGNRFSSVKGLGSTKPAVVNGKELKPEDGANRRVEVEILPAG